MKNQKKKIANKLNEYGDGDVNKKQVVMTSDKYDEMGDELGDDTIVKIVDEAGEVAPEATEAPVNPQKLQADVQRFMNKLGSSQFGAMLAKIDKPVEKAEMIAAFSELVGVPRAKLPMIVSMIKGMAGGMEGGAGMQATESVRPKMKKSDLVEHVLKTKKK